MDYGKNWKLIHLIALGMEICNGYLKSSQRISEILMTYIFWAPAFYRSLYFTQLSPVGQRLRL